MRQRWRGFVVPATVGTVTTAVLLAFRRPPELAPFIWPGLATASGAVVIVVIDLATAAAAEARVASERLGDRLPAHVAAEVEARLVAIATRLATLRSGEEREGG
jgi:hypothetical protein